MHAREIVHALCGKWFSTYGMVRCVVHDDGKPSLRLTDGDTGTLLVRCYAGCEPADILGELRRRNLLDGPAQDRDPGQSERIRQRADESRRHREEWALRVWRESIPAAGTAVEMYLRSRGITTPIPPSLRFHPRLEHTESGSIAAAMVAGVQIAPDREIRGIHRTYLAPDGSDKAFGADSKLSLGTISGGAIRLAAARPDRDLIIGEGIETTLSAMQATGLPGWAAISTAGMRALVLPERVQRVLIAADTDPNGAGEVAAKMAAERWMAEGRKVRIALPPLLPGQKKTDFNDILRRGSAAGIKDIPHVA
jgi:putative DNA primase/helicase